MENQSQTEMAKNFKVIGADELNNEIVYLVMDSDEMCKVVTSKEASEKYPMSVLEFYERRIVEQFGENVC